MHLVSVAKPNIIPIEGKKKVLKQIVEYNLHISKKINRERESCSVLSSIAFLLYSSLVFKSSLYRLLERLGFKKQSYIGYWVFRKVFFSNKCNQI